MFASRNRVNGDYTFIDTSDPDYPKEAQISDADKKQFTDEHWPHDKDGFIEVDPIVYTAKRIPSITQVSNAALVFTQSSDQDHKTYLEIKTREPETFDAEHFKNAYHENSKKYAACLKSRMSPDFCKIVAANFGEDSNLVRLLDGQPNGITKEDRVLMLNDAGFWLSAMPHLYDLDKAETFLRKVIELSPNRASAYLNLGDIYYRKVQFAKLQADKISVAKAALDAYTNYMRLSGKKAFRATELQTFLAIAESAQDPCAYVADAYRHKVEREIFVPLNNIDIYNNGKTVNIEEKA